MSQRLSTLRRCYGLYQMEGPTGPRALIMRRAYVGAFWNIETQPRRERFEIAGRVFEPDDIPAEAAESFRRSWLKWTHEQTDERIAREGFLFVPLQSRLFERRNWQACSPVEMLDHVLAANPDSPVVVSLHPRATYSTAERAFLTDFLEKHPRVTLSDRPMADLLATTDAVVTMNSAVAFHGFFFRKPAVLFADVDFHHIARKADPQNPEKAFYDLKNHQPDFARYLYWFLKVNAINGGKDTAPMQILERLSHLGWPL